MQFRVPLQPVIVDGKRYLVFPVNFLLPKPLKLDLDLYHCGREPTKNVKGLSDI